MNNDYQNKSEKELLELTLQGEQNAFGVLVKEYQGKLRAYAARYVYSSEDILDLVQDSFLDALKNLEKFDLAREFNPWIRRILHNNIIDFYHSSKKKRSLNLSIVDEAILEYISESPEDNEIKEDKILLLRNCISDLKGPQKDLIIARYFERISVKQLADVANQSETSISMKLMRIREKLKKCMEAKLPNPN